MQQCVKFMIGSSPDGAKIFSHLKVKMVGPVKREYFKRLHRRKHHTEESRKEAKREASRRYYRKHRDEILRKARERRGTRRRGREYGPMFIGPLRRENTRRHRKVRSNKGVRRGPRHFPRSTNLFA